MGLKQNVLKLWHQIFMMEDVYSGCFAGIETATTVGNTGMRRSNDTRCRGPVNRRKCGKMRDNTRIDRDIRRYLKMHYDMMESHPDPAARKRFERKAYEVPDTLKYVAEKYRIGGKRYEIN